MPLYAYQCNKCGEEFEAIRAMNASDEEVICPRCGEKRPRRVISLVCGGSQGSDSGSLRFPS